MFTYNAPDKHTGRVTYGGYSDSIVVDERFVLRIPTNLDLAGAAPLLCAGITTWSPLRRQGVGKGKKVGVVGLGGLGHMGVKFARALGAHVVVFTTSPAKTEDALRLGAHEVVVSRNAERDGEARRDASTSSWTPSPRCTTSTPYLHALQRGRQPHARRRAGQAARGLGVRPHLREQEPLRIAHRRHPDTQEMLDFCGEHGITADVEVIPIQKVNEAYERLLRSDVKYRFSIDMASLKAE